MTTIAFRDGTMACDSLVTGSFKSIINSKVVVGQNCMVGFCGDPIAAWDAAQYLAGELQDKPNICGKDDVLFLMYKDKKLYLVDGELRQLPLDGNKYYAIGSGEQAAMVAMHMGATAAEAVKMAIKVDDGSGGRVREYTLG